MTVKYFSKLLLFVIIFLQIETVDAQKSVDYYIILREKVDEIYNELRDDNLHHAIDLIDDFLRDYPNTEYMYYNRAYAKRQLNQYEAAKQDFLKAQSLGFQDSTLNFFLSKEYAANLIAESHIDGRLSLKNNLKPIFTRKDSLQGALRPERTCFDVLFYDLKVRVIPDEKKIIGENIIHFKVIEDTKKIQIDLFDIYEIQSIKYKDKTLNFKREYNAIFIDFEEALKIGEYCELFISYSGIPRVAPSPPWNGGFVWKKKRGKDWIGVACEHLGASSWWPNKDHLSDKPDSMKITIEVPKDIIAISNGNFLKSYEADSAYHGFEWFVSYPINNYNATFYAGDFVQFGEDFENENGTYRIDYYVQRSNLRKAKKFYKNTKDVVKVFERIFGEYPFKNDGLAMVEAPYTGMEHQSAIAIGSDYGKSKRRNYQEIEYDYLVVHETAHEWWGNAVAVGDMSDAWINEGFATYSEMLFLEEMYGYKAYINGIAVIMKSIYNIWPVVGIQGVNDNTFLGGDIYNKGAIMLHNLRCIMNDDERFKQLIKSYYNESKFKINTTEEFIHFVNNFTKKDYTPFLETFLYFAEPPLLKYAIIKEGADIVFYYKFEKVKPGFEMPFNVISNKKEGSVKLIGSTELKSVRIENASFCYLPTGTVYREDMKKNSFTYFFNSKFKIKDVKSTYGNGNILNAGMQIGKFKEGEWKTYYPNKVLKSTVIFSKGLKDGSFASFYENGDKETLMFYVNDTLQGECHYFTNNKIHLQKNFTKGVSDTIAYFSNGVIESKGILNNNLEEGEWELFYSNGERSASGMFEKGKPIENTWSYFTKEGAEVFKMDTVSSVSEKPEYRAGLEDLYKLVNKNLKMTIENSPKESGTVYISFLVSPNGCLTGIKQENDYGVLFGAQVVDILKKGQRWKPGYLNGNPVYTKMVLPFKFQIPEQKEVLKAENI